MFKIKDILKVAEKLNIDFSKFPLNDFITGINIELEHGMVDPLTNVTNNDLLWIFQSTTICLLRNLFDKYRVIAHLFEHTGAQLKWKYRITNPDFSMSSTLQKAYKVICCEYNRSHIAKGIYQLEELPVVLPNKYIVEEDSVDTLPEDVAKVIEPILKKIDGKKVLIYQGIFMDKERRLEEFCQAVQFLPDEYVLIAMGRGSQMYERIKEQYESDRVIFIPFIICRQKNSYMMKTVKWKKKLQQYTLLVSTFVGRFKD